VSNQANFEPAKFHKFCSNLTINSKELGTIKLSKPFGPQRWVIQEIARGLEEGIHDFTVLKCRQIGLSTIMLALDLYWPFTHQGLDGTIITHDESTHVSFRTQLTEYYNSLPKMWKPQSPSHNRHEFVFRFNAKTISRLQYQIAGTRESGNSKLGRAKGNAYLHGTEMAFWGDQSAYQSLRNSLAETNPNRLYLWESTANGFNEFEEQWRMATRATTMRGIFVSWWAHELYRCPRNDQRFKVYWGSDGKMTKEEHRLARDVALLYPKAMESVNGTTEISPEQIAWFRWYSEEKVGDPDMVMQEMPWTEHQAFVTTGSAYFKGKFLTDSYKRVNKEPTPTFYRIEIAHTLEECKVIPCPARVSNFEIYAEPVEKAVYVLGADPAYGSSDWADAFVISVWRCYADGIDQVAEFATPDCLPYGFAWIMCYIAGIYAPCAWNLEVNGPGLVVLGEIDQLKRQQFTGTDSQKKVMRNFLGGMREFLYARPDSLTRSPSARGTSTTYKEKNRYFHTFRDYFSRGMATVHSRRMLEEMRWITQMPGSAPEGSSRHKDDRVIGGCLAVQHWHDKLRGQLMRQNITRNRTESTPGREMSVVDIIAARQKRLLGMS
jgi:hypothetical protein